MCFVYYCSDLSAVCTQVRANVTTGPQPGSPARPKELTLSKTVSSVTLHWRNSHSGKAPILGYYIEAKKIGKYFISSLGENKHYADMYNLRNLYLLGSHYP